MPLAGTYNIRDLGGYPVAGGGMTRWRQVLRSDSLHGVDDAGIDYLINAGLRTVIDLRHPEELCKKPNPFSINASVFYVNIPVFAELHPSHSICNTSRDGQENVLFKLYCLAFSKRQTAIFSVLKAIANADEGMVLFHCAIGKDRTGIIAALLLLSAGVGRDTVLEDYALTATLIKPLSDQLVKDSIAQGKDGDALLRLLTADPETMRAALDHLDESYGDVISYIELLGMESSLIDKLRSRLLAHRR